MTKQELLKSIRDGALEMQSIAPDRFSQQELEKLDRMIWLLVDAPTNPDLED